MQYVCFSCSSCLKHEALVKYNMPILLQLSSLAATSEHDKSLCVLSFNLDKLSATMLSFNFMQHRQKNWKCFAAEATSKLSLNNDIHLFQPKSIKPKHVLCTSCPLNWNCHLCLCSGLTSAFTASSYINEHAYEPILSHHKWSSIFHLFCIALSYNRYMISGRPKYSTPPTYKQYLTRLWEFTG